MKRLFNILVVTALLLGGSGCATKLAPNGVYKQDYILYNVDDAYVRTRTMLDIIFQWEANMPNDLFPELRAAMNNIRAAAIKADKEFHQMRKEYIIVPNDKNKTALDNAIKRYTALLASATKLYVKK
jgi:hypothetical protein